MGLSFAGIPSGSSAHIDVPPRVLDSWQHQATRHPWYEMTAGAEGGGSRDFRADQIPRAAAPRSAQWENVHTFEKVQLHPIVFPRLSCSFRSTKNRVSPISTVPSVSF
jgi:hypothetical protein